MLRYQLRSPNSNPEQDADCAAEEVLCTAKKQLMDSKAVMNSEYNSVVIYPTDRSSEETPPALAPQHEALEATLGPCHLSFSVIEGAE